MYNMVVGEKREESEMAGLVKLESGELQASFPYSVEAVAAVRTVPCRQWDAARKLWRFPNTPEVATVLGQLASRFEWTIDATAAAVVHQAAEEIDEILAMAIEGGDVKATSEPEVGYSVRGGGSMHDGTVPHLMFRSRTGAAGLSECEADRSGLSGSGRSGHVDYELDSDGVYELRETSGNIKRQASEACWALRRRGQWYSIGTRQTALMLLGVDPATDARVRAERQAAASDDYEDGAGIDGAEVSGYYDR